MPSTQASLQHLLNKRNKVSAHYLLDQKGKIYSLVNEKDIAWHAGISSWKADKLLNKKSIGIELVNRGNEFFPNKFNSLSPSCNVCVQLLFIFARII